MAQIFEVILGLPNWLLVCVFLGAINTATFAVFGWDKRAARLNNQRVPETKLLFLVLIGGGIGALFGQKYFRHKTKKQPFKRRMMIIIIMQIMLVPPLLWVLVAQ